MATKKRKKKPAKANKVASKKAAVKKMAAPKKKLVAKKALAKKAAAKKKAPAKKNRARAKKRRATPIVFESAGRGARAASVAPEDLHGASEVEDADSESVDELLEEGNAFEAEAVKGVEDASEDPEGEVRTHEVPEDDVPQEYLDDEQ
jgi:hypothetical protein